MTDAPASLAQAAARIAELQDELTAARSEVDLATTGASATREQLAAVEQEVATLRPLRARVIELEQLLSPPPALSGIAVVQRYRTPHGSEHAMLGDAMHAMKIHSLTSGVGMTLPQAEAAVLRAEAIVKILSASE
jgi:hypothetical protein